METIGLLVTSTPFREPPTPQNIPLTPCWTPGTDAASPPTPLVTDTVRAYNSAMDTIANLTARETKREPLISQLKTPLNNLSKAEQLNVVQKASEDCLLVCSAIAPGSGEELFKSMAQSTQREKFEGSPPGDLVVLMTAYKNAKTKNLKRQILSLYAYRYPMSMLQKIHQPYGKLSTWEIKQARSHANLSGPGTTPEVTTKHRVRLDMSKVDHFVEFTNRPYFYQDVSYGSKILILESGDRIEMPNVVRTVTRSTMIEQYLEYCKEQCHEPLSRSTLFKILEVREASQRKSLQGLDNTAADGAAGFQTLETLVETLEKGGMEKQWCLDVRRKLRDAKRYLKTDFRVHCQPHDSTCADHCRHFALSDPVEADFQQPCSHEHVFSCDDCQGMKNVLQEVRLGIEGSSWTPYSSEQREDLLYDFYRAKSDILLWKAHVIRSINQEEAKQDALRSADDTSAILIMDWAMKFLQIRYREKQSDWFGKRGLSWHISTVITKNASTGKVELKSYAHIFDSCQQDWYAVCSIIESTLEVVKKDHPQITRVSLRSDEAGCYHNNFLLAAVRDAGKRVGLTVTQYDFSEPQYGKDVCDRILCPMKSAIRRYCSEGNDVLSAKDMCTALSERPVRGTTACVCSVNETQKTLEVNKVDGFSRYHNFKFELNGIRVWRAYGVGKGKVIPYQDIIVKPQGPTDLVVDVDFFPVKETRFHKATSSDDQQSSGLFFCSEPGCQMVFKKFSELESHLDVGEHRQVRRGSETVYDKLRRDWAEKFLTVDNNEETGRALVAHNDEQRDKNEASGSCSDLQLGWALHKPRSQAVRFMDEVKQYLTTKFDLGERTGNKADPGKVAADMRTSRKPDGSRMFERKDWLTKSQVQGFFSRLAATRRRQGNQEVQIEDVYAEEEEQERHGVLENVAAQLSPRHPICYDSYCLCDISRDEKLDSFSVVMLKEILRYFEVPFASKDRKTNLVVNLSKFLEGCECRR